MHTNVHRIHPILNLQIRASNHRLTYSHSWGLPQKCIRMHIHIHAKIFVFFFFWKQEDISFDASSDWTTTNNQPRSFTHPTSFVWWLHTRLPLHPFLGLQIRVLARTLISVETLIWPYFLISTCIHASPYILYVILASHSWPTNSRFCWKHNFNWIM